MMKEKEIIEFSKKWLESWTGNNPEKLITFYSDNSYYQDPANPNGLNSHKQILPYFKKLLEANPNWKWEVEEVFPTNKGFILKWKAIIPIGKEEIIELGMDILEIENGKITRNEVYFDRTKFLSLLELLRTQK